MSAFRPPASAVPEAPPRRARRASSRPGDGGFRATIRHLVGPHVVAYHPSFAAVGGSINAGLLLAQLFYWHDRGRDPDGWIYKTQAEWEAETGLTRWQQEAARQQLRERGLVEEKLAGLPARLYYRLNVERLVQLLSARVGRRLRRADEAEESDARGPRTPVQPAASSTGTPERHNQDCGSPTNKDVANPQTSSRVSHTHAETTNRDYSREKRTEKLPAGPLADALGESSVPSSAGSDESVSVTAAEPYPSERICSLHGVPMRLRRKGGDHWYSHRLRNGTWCKGAPGDQGDDGPEAGPDPQSIESRREYLGWADPAAHRKLRGAPRPADYGAYRAGLYQAGAYRAAASHAAAPRADQNRARVSDAEAHGPGAYDAEHAPPLVHCTSAVRVYCTSRPNQPAHDQPAHDQAAHSTSHPNQERSPPTPPTPHHQPVHCTSAVQVHCTSHPNQPAHDQPVHHVSRPSQGRALPTRPVRHGHAVTPPSSPGRSPPAPRALPVALLEDIGIVPPRTTVRGPPSPRPHQTIEYRRC